MTFVRQHVAANELRRPPVDHTAQAVALHEDVFATVDALILALTTGRIKSGSTALALIKNVAKNFARQRGDGTPGSGSGRSKRFSEQTESFYELLQLRFGPECVRFVSAVNHGPSQSTVRREVRKHRTQVPVCTTDRAGFTEFLHKITDFIQKRQRTLGIADGELMANLGEDESMVQTSVEYAAELDSLVGFCGDTDGDGEKHTCSESAAVLGPVRDNQAQQFIDEAFRRHHRASYIRLLLLQPMHPSFPAVPVFVMATCLRFDAGVVRKQQNFIQEVWDREGFRAKVGPLMLNGSDGDSRRRQVNVARCGSGDGSPVPDGAWKPPFKGMVHHAPISPLTGLPVHLPAADMLHNAKKMIGPLDRAGRPLMLGESWIVMDDLAALLEKQPSSIHGLRLADVLRRDRMCLRTVQKLVSVWHLLRKHSPAGTAHPTAVYMEVIWMYLMAFFCPFLSMCDRAMYLFAVKHFFVAWKVSLSRRERPQIFGDHLSPPPCLKDNFISAQAFRDLLLSCDCAIMYMCVCRDYAPSLGCHLSLMGSDCCESTFSKMATFKGGRRVCTVLGAQRMLRAMVRIAEMATKSDDVRCWIRLAQHDFILCSKSMLQKVLQQDGDSLSGFNVTYSDVIRRAWDAQTTIQPTDWKALPSEYELEALNKEAFKRVAKALRGLGIAGDYIGGIDALYQHHASVPRAAHAETAEPPATEEHLSGGFLIGNADEDDAREAAAASAVLLATAGGEVAGAGAAASAVAPPPGQSMTVITDGSKQIMSKERYVALKQDGSRTPGDRVRRYNSSAAKDAAAAASEETTVPATRFVQRSDHVAVLFSGDDGSVLYIGRIAQICVPAQKAVVVNALQLGSDGTFGAQVRVRWLQPTVNLSDAAEVYRNDVPHRDSVTIDGSGYPIVRRLSLVDVRSSGGTGGSGSDAGCGASALGPSGNSEAYTLAAADFKMLVTFMEDNKDNQSIRADCVRAQTELVTAERELSQTMRKLQQHAFDFNKVTVRDAVADY